MGIRTHREGQGANEEPQLAARKDLQRAERIREVMAELARLSVHVPVIVEGKRDREALKALGVEGEIIVFNKGVGVDEFCDDVAERTDKVVLLTDWDREGDALLEKIGRCLPGHWEEFGLFRETLKALSQKDIRDVEGLPVLLRRLEAGMVEETLIPKEDF